MREEKECLNCGEKFMPTCHITRQKYCSDTCRHRYNNAKRHYNVPVNICPECGDRVEQRESGSGRWRIIVPIAGHGRTGSRPVFHGRWFSLHAGRQTVDELMMWHPAVLSGTSWRGGKSSLRQ